jgi:hypothetical protein
MFITNISPIRLFVHQSFLGIQDSPKLEEAYLIAVTSIPNGPLMFTAHLESGAVWQRLPIEAFWAPSNLYPIVDNKDGVYLSNPELQPFSCLHGKIQAITYEHLREYEVLAKIGDELYSGQYLFTVDVLGEGLASDPVQHKSHNVVVLENGQLAALPNNYVRFMDNYFTKNELPRYKRCDTIYKPGG